MNLTRRQQVLLHRAARARDGAAAFVARMTDTKLLELVRRCDQPIDMLDGYGAARPAQAVSGSGGDSSTETAAIARLDQAQALDDPRAVLRALSALDTMATAALHGDRALQTAEKNTAHDPGEYEPACRNCGEKKSDRTDFPGWRLRAERCPRCYMHWYRTGEEAPKICNQPSTCDETSHGMNVDSVESCDPPRRGEEQSEARRPHKPEDAGSSPVAATEQR